MILTLQALVCLVGLLIYVLAKSPTSGEIREVGRIMFFCGLLSFLLNGDQLIRLVGH